MKTLLLAAFFGLTSLHAQYFPSDCFDTLAMVPPAQAMTAAPNTAPQSYLFFVTVHRFAVCGDELPKIINVTIRYTIDGQDRTRIDLVPVQEIKESPRGQAVVLSNIPARAKIRSVGSHRVVSTEDWEETASNSTPWGYLYWGADQSYSLGTARLFVWEPNKQYQSGQCAK